VLGYAAADAPKLRSKLLEMARSGDAKEGAVDPYGQRYTVDSVVATEQGTAVVRSGWIILRGTKVPRLTTCYVRVRRGK
jgi:hypothetical protein